MSYLVVMIVDDPDDCPAILDAWETLGVSGVTILESSGLGHLRKLGMREDMPLLPSLSDFMQQDEIPHRMLLSVVKDQEMVDRMITTVQHISGDLDQPNSGFLFVVPVLQAIGLNRKLED
ncbi:MAG TPA: P-II family nitrogen regulator [Anaerolineales bacterium]|nr:P-II family nitrogen regulator [Anaerolineales bacterium]